MLWMQIVGVMVIAGVAGGTVNFGLVRTDDSGWKDWAWSVIIGVGAAFLVPLFLNTISSSLIDNILPNPDKPLPVEKILVFAGFCLLGAIASKAMIQSLTQKWLKEAAEVRKELKSLKEEVGPIVEKETEAESPLPLASAEKQSKALNMGESTGEVFRALGASRFALRALSGIAADVGKPSGQVAAALQELIQMGLAAEVQGKKGPRWSLTPEGRRQLVT
jgi:hypothetical protein